MVKVNQKDIESFQKTVQGFYKQNGRHDLPWRQLDVNGCLNPYHVVVSELMLQQTQVPRVIPKFNLFLEEFPTIEILAAAPLANVLRAWTGLGYNRRAQYLHKIAQQVVQEYEGKLPSTKENLVKLPGIGSNTAGAVLVYAYSQPVVFVETNIRTVFIHHFFKDEQNISDSTLLPTIKSALKGQQPREWYWALMDYGTHIKKHHGNASKTSKHYTKQSPFEGSRRQIRGQVLRELGSSQQTLNDLAAKVTDKRLAAVVKDLQKEGLITEKEGRLSL